MPAKSKDELLSATATEYTKLARLIEPLAPDIALAKDTEDTSIKDVVAHRAHWISLFIGWHTDGLAGRTVHFPAEGYKWNELKRYNAELRAKQTNLSWDESRACLADRHGKLMDFIKSHSDADLYAGPMKGAKNDWTTGRWAEAAGPSHYRSAAKYIRSRLRTVSSGKQA